MCATWPRPGATASCHLAPPCPAPPRRAWPRIARLAPRRRCPRLLVRCLCPLLAPLPHTNLRPRPLPTHPPPQPLPRQRIASRPYPLPPVSFSPCRAPARVKKTGVARLSQRFGHWATNDHPQYSPSAASPAATTPAAAATPPTAGKPAAAATPGFNAAATPTPPPGKSTPAVPRAAVPTRREPPPGTVPPTAAHGERSSMLPERLMNCRCFKCIPA